jgi:K+-transporting ATPase ATPase A chain
MTGRKRAGWALYGIMVFLFALGIVIVDYCERPTPPHLADLQLVGGNLEGKEVRFGIGSSTLTAVVTSNGATGSTNAAPDSLTPLACIVPLSNMLLGEITFGGLGTGLYSMIMIALVGLFMAGLIVGRTPEYLGKRLGPREMKLVMLFNLATPITVLALTALAVITPAGIAGLSTHSGPHGFTEVLFGYASCVANNGQVMGGLNGNSFFYNLTTAPAMMIGRFGLAIPALALSGLLAAQGRRVTTTGSLPSDSLLFAIVVIGSALLVGGLNFFPALALGPVIEHFLTASSHGLF